MRKRISAIPYSSHLPYNNKSISPLLYSYHMAMFTFSSRLSYIKLIKWPQCLIDLSKMQNKNQHRRNIQKCVYWSNLWSISAAKQLIIGYFKVWDESNVFYEAVYSGVVHSLWIRIRFGLNKKNVLKLTRSCPDVSTQLDDCESFKSQT